MYQNQTRKLARTYMEYALGKETSEWGAKRAANGHPKPFPLKYIEIGNEASSSVYSINYNKFFNAIHNKYPQVRIISNHKNIENKIVDIYDEHKYGTPESFIDAFNTIVR